MNNIKACIFNIQKYSIHDGPGIRTVVFFKGCPLRCLWCSNPESQDTKIQILCDKTNSSDADKSLPAEGKLLTVAEVMKEVMKDEVFYEESKGGVTLSGGEVLMQHEFAAQLLKLLKERNIHTAIETTGFTSNEIFSKFTENVDLLLFDMKHYDREKHFKATKFYNDLIIENLKTAIDMGKEVIVRIPVIPGINNDLKDAEGFCRLLNSVNAENINLLPFHQFGQKKYTLLNRPYAFENVKQLHEEDLLDYQNIFLKSGFNCYF